MTGLEKLGPEHKARAAFVYVRQSTMEQVRRNQTSTERQCGLSELAVELGWAPAQVELVLGDLGSSAKFSEDRDGFQRVATELALGRVGAILSTEVSRLARSSADWHRLIEVAGLTRTVLIDERTIYDPRDPNDRLVLGMKGTMAEFELVWLRQRMNEGKKYRAQQGRLWLHPPIGYVYDNDRLVLDPDEEVRRAVNQVFERYRASGSCVDVARYFHEHGLRFPARTGDQLSWGRLTRDDVRRILGNPRYAGAYVHGRTQMETILEQGRRRDRQRRLPMSQWQVVLHDKHPAYVTWEEFMANQKRLGAAGPRLGGSATPGAAGSGAALLQGMLLCGRCGNRLSTHYGGSAGRYPTYTCSRLSQNGIGAPCVTVTRRFIDEPVTDVVLGALAGQPLDAAAKVVDMLDQEDAAVEQQWRLRLERARYEAKRAERQYDACEPENRVVARTLETRWNSALEELAKVQREHEDFRQRRRTELTELDRRRIAELSGDVRKLWVADTTTDRDRKLLLRILLQDVSVTPIEVPRRALRLRLLWHTQAVTEVEVDRPGSNGRKRTVVRWRVLDTAAPVATTSTLPAPPAVDGAS